MKKSYVNNTLTKNNKFNPNYSQFCKIKVQESA